MNVFFKMYTVSFLKAVILFVLFTCVLSVCAYMAVCVCVCVCVFSQLPIPRALLLTLILLRGWIHFL